MKPSHDERIFDDLLIEYGEFGRYQIWIYNLLCLFLMITPWWTFTLIFESRDMPHWCKIPEWDSINCNSYGFNTSRECTLAKRDVGIPWNYSDVSHTEKVFSSCKRYNVSGVDFSPDMNLQGRGVIPCDGGWEYGETDGGGTSVVKDFNAVCGSSYYVSLAQTLFFAGTGFGSLLSGIISDRFGRRRTTFLSLALTIATGIGLAFPPNVVLFLVLRFVLGITVDGMLYPSYVLANEIIGPSKRNWAGNIVWIYYAFGYMTLSLFAYFIRDWRHLQLTVSLVPILIMLTRLTIPESPRWLLTIGRKSEAERIVRKLAKWNGVVIHETFNMDNVVAEKSEEKNVKHALFELFRRPILRRYTINLQWQVITAAVVYFGMSLYSDSLGVNLYLAFAVSGAVDIPACFFAIFAIEYWGRRPTHMALMLLCGAALLVMAFIAPGVAKTVVAMVGRFAISAAFNIGELRSCEIIPTVVRNAGFGLILLSSNFSNMIGPQILVLERFWSPLPPVIFGSMALSAGLVGYLLPETRGKKIPETLEDGEDIGWA